MKKSNPQGLLFWWRVCKPNAPNFYYIIGSALLSSDFCKKVAQKIFPQFVKNSLLIFSKIFCIIMM